MIKVLFFAHLRDLAKTDEIELPLAGMTHVGDVIAAMEATMPIELISALEEKSALVSINHKYAGWDAELSDGDEVGILPPVSGG